MKTLEERSYIIYYPRVKLHEAQEFKLGEYEFIPLKSVSGIENYISDELMEEKGCLLKFQGKHIFDLKEHINIFEFTESLKFCYFSNNIPHRSSFLNNFAVNESFNPYVIINKNTDLSFEAKITISNGFFEKMIKRDDFILSKIKNIEYVCVGDIFFKNYNPELYGKFLDELYLYNQITKINDTYHFHNKTLFSRLSIEAAIKKMGLGKNNYVSRFNGEIDNYILGSNLEVEYKEIFDFYNIEIRSNLNFIHDKIENYLLNINEIRKKLAHDGEEDREGRFLIFFAIWFELFLELCTSTEAKTSYAVKLVLFLWIMHFDLEKWDHNKDFFKKTYLYQYCEIFRLYYKYKKNDILKIYIDSITIQLRKLKIQESSVS